jgi:hypothetical protein
MIFRRMLSVLVMSALLVYAITPALLAGENTSSSRHVATPAQLHQAVQDSGKIMMEARECVENYIARPEVAAQLQRYGVGVSEVKTRVATLSDSELLMLQNQIMREDLAKETAGGLTKAGKILTFIGIPIMVAGIIMIAKGSSEDRIGDSDLAINWKATGAIWTGVGAVLTIIGLTRRN